MEDNIVTDFFAETLILGIPLISWLISLVAMVVAFVVLRVAVGFLLRRLRTFAAKPGARFSQIMVEVVSGTSNFLLALASILIGVGLLDVPARWADRVSSLWFIVIMLQVALWATRAISLAMQHYFSRSVSGQPAQVSALSSITMWAGKVLLWTVVLLAMLSNLGVNITAFVASLGVGGIAVALAVQNILGDLFASLSIAVDKPFEVGDFIVIGSLAGSVEHVGLKTTRIRSLGGEQIVMANTAMLSANIQNYKRLMERRVVFAFGVTYDVTPDQARAVTKLVREIIESIERTRFDRAHLRGFGDSSVDFEVVYYVLDPSYNTYMDIQQEINLRLMEHFAEMDVSFAFPTRTLHVASVPAGLASERGDGSPAGGAGETGSPGAKMPAGGGTAPAMPER